MPTPWTRPLALLLFFGVGLTSAVLACGYSEPEGWRSKRVAEHLLSQAKYELAAARFVQAMSEQEEPVFVAGCRMQAAQALTKAYRACKDKKAQAVLGQRASDHLNEAELLLQGVPTEELDEEWVQTLALRRGDLELARGDTQKALEALDLFDEARPSESAGFSDAVEAFCLKAEAHAADGDAKGLEAALRCYAAVAGRSDPRVAECAFVVGTALDARARKLARSAGQPGLALANRLLAGKTSFLAVTARGEGAASEGATAESSDRRLLAEADALQRRARALFKAYLNHPATLASPPQPEVMRDVVKALYSWG